MTTWQFFCYIILWIALMHHMKCYLNITRNHITHCLRVLFLITITLTRRSGKQKSDTFMQTVSSKPNNKHWILHLCLYISDIMFALKEYHISPVQLGNISSYLHIRSGTLHLNCCKLLHLYTFHTLCHSILHGNLVHNLWKHVSILLIETLDCLWLS